MIKLLHKIGKRLLISKHRKQVRNTFVFALAHLFLLAAIFFTIQIAAILLGANDIFFPAAHRLISIIQ